MSEKAFPVYAGHGSWLDGMDLRDYFAAKAVPLFNWKNPEDCARKCYVIADALMDAKDEEKHE